VLTDVSDICQDSLLSAVPQAVDQYETAQANDTQANQKDSDLDKTNHWTAIQTE